MGSGLAQAYAMAGLDVVLHDVDPTALPRAILKIEDSLGRFVRAGRMVADQTGQVASRIALDHDLEHSVAGADVVSEAVPESLEAKQHVLAVAAKGATDALLTTMTSHLTVGAIADGLPVGADRLVAMKLVPPVVMMRLVEIARSDRTSDATFERALELAARIDKEPVICNKDVPGFISGAPYALMRLECIRNLEAGVADAASIDRAFRLAYNLPVGPLESGDLSGLDIYLQILEGLAKAYGDRYEPTPGLRRMVAEGRLGKKTGVGFFRYDANGRRLADDL